MVEIAKVCNEDPKLMENGTWVPLAKYDPVFEDAQVLVRAFGNTEYEEFMNPIRRQYRNSEKGIPEEKHEEGLCRFIFVGTKNVTENNKEIGDSYDSRLKAIKSMPRFKSLITQAAMEWANFKRGAQEAESKNSQSSPSGTSTTEPAKQENK